MVAMVIGHFGPTWRVKSRLCPTRVSTVSIPCVDQASRPWPAVTSLAHVVGRAGLNAPVACSLALVGDPPLPPKVAAQDAAEAGLRPWVDALRRAASVVGRVERAAGRPDVAVCSLEVARLEDGLKRIDVFSVVEHPSRRDQQLRRIVGRVVQHGTPEGPAP